MLLLGPQRELLLGGAGPVAHGIPHPGHSALALALALVLPVQTGCCGILLLVTKLEVVALTQVLSAWLATRDQCRCLRPPGWVSEQDKA